MADSNNAQIGSQVTFSFWDTSLSPDAWAALGKVRSINGMGVDLPEVDSTTLDSTAVERIAGLPDGKEMSIVLTLTATSLAAIEAICAARTPIDCRIVFPSPASLSRYFSLTPRGYDKGTITPSGLVEVTFNGRITAAISSTDSHP